MRLTKHHGLGNDFLVVLDLDGSHPVGPSDAVALCDRRTGIGADGLLHVTAADGEADVTMALFNADGSRAEMSGNGIRCLAQAVFQAVGDRARVQERHRRYLLHDTTSRLRRTSRRNGLSDASAAPSATTLYSVSRSTGVRPALRMMRTISAGLITCGVSAPAM